MFHQRGHAVWFVSQLVCLLMAWQLWVDSGWAQQVQETGTRATALAAAATRTSSTDPLGIRETTAPASKVSPRSTGPSQVPDFRQVISVGRALSSYTTSAIVNSALTITYTVYNLRGEAVDGVLPTTTLQPGVTSASSTPNADRNGQQLAFSLGTLPPLGSASATLNVTLASPIPTQIDSGAQASGHWNGRMVAGGATASALRTGTVSGNLLAPSPDANSQDPIVAGVSAQFGNDPTASSASCATRSATSRTRGLCAGPAELYGAGRGTRSIKPICWWRYCEPPAIRLNTSQAH